VALDVLATAKIKTSAKDYLMQTRTLMLASASPRRAELLSQIGVEFIQQPVDLDESALTNEPPKAQVLRLAAEKANAAWLQAEGTAQVVLASDTMVVLENQALGKPRNADHARSMLQSLSGRQHEVMTSVSVRDATRQKTLCVVTQVVFGPLTAAQIDDYWATGEPADKAGAYGIQGIGGQFVKSINGSYSAVVGLPLYETVQLLKEFEVMS
jgi:septum formation protein